MPCRRHVGRGTKKIRCASTHMPSCRNNRKSGPWGQGWLWKSHPEGVALTLGISGLARAGHESAGAL
jgi:hypothetical protein